MRIANLNKRGLLDLFGSSDMPSPVSQQTFPKIPPDPDSFYLLWEEDKTGLPSAIIVNDNELKDLIAWTSTFIGTIKPFTAFIRVMPYSVAADYSVVQASPNFDGYESVCAAMIIAEALSNAPEKVHPNTLTPLVCGSTYSYALARAFALNITFDSFNTIIEKISSVRDLSGQAPRKVSPYSILAIWYVLYSIRCDSNNTIFANHYMNSFLDALKKTDSSNNKDIKYYLQYICDACYQFKTFGDIDDNTFFKFTKAVQLDQQRNLWEKTKEINVINFKNVMTILLSEVERPTFATAFLCGYFANKVAPGTFSHVDLVWSYIEKLPTALLWYAIFAGLSKKNDVLQSSDCLPLRVIRDLFAPSGLLNIPSCDISVDELEVLMTGTNKSINFKHGYSGHLQVEVAPNVITKVRWIDPDKSYPSPQQNINTPKYSVAAIEEIGVLLRQMERVYKEISIPSNYSSSSKSNPYLATKEKPYNESSVYSNNNPYLAKTPTKKKYAKQSKLIE